MPRQFHRKPLQSKSVLKSAARFPKFVNSFANIESSYQMEIATYTLTNTPKASQEYSVP